MTGVGDGEAERAGRRVGRRGIGAAAILLAVAVLVILRLTSGGDPIGPARDWVESLGLAGPVAFAALYAAAVVLALPTSPLTAGAGVLFGPVIGYPTVMVGSMLGAAAAFALARSALRPRSAGWIDRSGWASRIDRLLAERGWSTVLAVRLVPGLPFSLLNYLLGASAVSTRTYLGATLLGIAPGKLAVTLGGDAVAQGLRDGEIPWGLVGVWAIATLLVVALAIGARRHLARRDPLSERESL